MSKRAGCVRVHHFDELEQEKLDGNFVVVRARQILVAASSALRPGSSGLSMRDSRLPGHVWMLPRAALRSPLLP